MENSRVFDLLLLQLGAKKGLGAQKVSSKSFSEVEKQAQVAEKLREEQAAEAKKQAEESMSVDTHWIQLGEHRSRRV